MMPAGRVRVTLLGSSDAVLEARVDPAEQSDPAMAR